MYVCLKGAYLMDWHSFAAYECLYVPVWVCEEQLGAA
jgi:hypothetical protein